MYKQTNSEFAEKTIDFVCHIDWFNFLLHPKYSNIKLCPIWCKHICSHSIENENHSTRSAQSNELQCKMCCVIMLHMPLVWDNHHIVLRWEWEHTIFTSPEAEYVSSYVRNVQDNTQRNDIKGIRNDSMQIKRAQLFPI